MLPPKDGTSICLYCGHLNPPGGGFTDHKIEEGVFFEDGCAFANWRCPTMDGWCVDRSESPNGHGHELPEHWVAATNAKLPEDPSGLIAEFLRRHEAAGTLSAHLA